jgi:hypothetical protein
MSLGGAKKQAVRGEYPALFPLLPLISSRPCPDSPKYSFVRGFSRLVARGCAAFGVEFAGVAGLDDLYCDEHDHREIEGGF